MPPPSSSACVSPLLPRRCDRERHRTAFQHARGRNRGAVGALVACCTVEVLVGVGVLAGLGGAAKGGIATAAGLTVAVAAWLTAIVVRRRRARPAADCWPPAGPTEPTTFTIEAGGR
jgi:hypothetical protein